MLEQHFDPNKGAILAAEAVDNPGVPVSESVVKRGGFTPDVAGVTWHPDDIILVPADLAEESGLTIADETEAGGFGERAKFLEAVAKAIRDLFKTAMEQGNMWLAFSQVRDSQRYGLADYNKMRERLKARVGMLLKMGDGELAEGYRTFLKGIEEEVRQMESGTFVGRLIAPSRKVPLEQDPEYLQALREIIPDLFEGMIKSREAGWAFEHLKRAQALGLEDYPAMKEKFLELLKSELAKDDEQIGQKYRKYLKYLLECLPMECWRRQGVAAQ